MAVHLRITSHDHKHYNYLCRKWGTNIIDGRWTTDEEKVTCKNCLKKMQKPITYIVTHEYKITKIA